MACLEKQIRFNCNLREFYEPIPVVNVPAFLFCLAFFFIFLSEQCHCGKKN